LSVDSLFVAGRFAEACHAPFPILPDFNREVCIAYGVRDDDYFGMRGVTKRAVFVVDREGKVA
jgi:glutaredoxin-dependent peroxiredoxin